MTEPITCSRCRRAFGGHFTWRRAHPNGRCRKVVGLRAIGLRQNGGGVWHRPGRWDPVQLSLFGSGRPRGHIPQYGPGTAFGRRAVSGNRGRTTHETPQLPLWAAA